MNSFYRLTIIIALFLFSVFLSPKNADASLLDDLVSYWSLDETSGDAIDAHGSNDLTDTNTVGNGIGKINNGRDFERGNNEYFTITDNTDLSTGDIDFTFSVWLKLESNVDSAGVVSKLASNGNREFDLRYVGSGLNKLYWLVFNNGSSYTQLEASSAGQLSTGTWYHVIVGHDSSANTTFIRVNGGTKDTTSHTTGVYDSTSSFRLGSNEEGGSAWVFDGLIDEVGFWKRVLTDDEMGELYNSGNGLAYEDFVPTITISGTVYSNEGSTALTTTPTVRVKVNGAGDYSAVANGSGVYSISGVTINSASDVVTVYLDGASEKAVTITKAADTSSSITGLNLYQDRVIIRHEDSGPVTNTNIDQYDGSSDADIPLTVTAGALTVTGSTSLYIWSGDTFTPGGNVTTPGLKVLGTYNNSTSNPNLTITRNFTLNSGSTFTKGTGTVVFNGVAQMLTDSNATKQDLGNIQIGSASENVGWFDSDWDYRRAITIDFNKVGSSSDTFHSNFPVLVSATYDDWKHTDFGGKVASSSAGVTGGGGDFVFTSSDGTTLLSHEIEKYASSSGQLFAWVKIASLSATEDTTLYVYYGGPSSGATNQDKAGTWNSGFKGVWHLKETDIDGGSGDIKDSTSNTNNGTTNNMDSSDQVAGKVDGAVNFNNQALEYIDVGNDSSLDVSAITISAWIKGDAWNDAYGPIFVKRPTGASAPFIGSYVKSNGTLAWYIFTDTANIASYDGTGSHTLSAGTWYYTTFVYDSSIGGIGYVNAESDDTFSANGAIASNNNNGRIGDDHPYDDREFDGIIDEVRISNVARSADWIRTEYNNMNSPSTFYAIGDEEGNTSVSLGSGTTVGNLTIKSAKTLDANGTNTITVGGHWTNAGTFTPSTSTVTFTGTNTASVSGETIFYNFTSTTSNKKIKFGSGEVFTFNGTITLTGGVSNLIRVESTASGSQWLAKMTNSQSGTITYTRFESSGCRSGTAQATLDSTNSNQSNNGTCWFQVQLPYLGPGVTFTGGGESGGGVVQTGGSQGVSGGTGGSEGQSGGGSQQGGGGQGSGGGGTSDGGGTPVMFEWLWVYKILSSKL